MASQDSIFKALADPTRREILEMLQKKDSMPGEIIKHFSMKKPSLSHHLDILKQAGLVTAERKGQNLIYSLNATVFDEVMMLMMGLFGKKDKKGRKGHV
jgi:ArsR family transcriptional regulator, arsenate/arsenite/antimonite-responsive transcriptional repressor